MVMRDIGCPNVKVCASLGMESVLPEKVAWGIRICAAARVCSSMPATAPTGAPASTATCLTNPAHRISTRGSVCLGIL